MLMGLSPPRALLASRMPSTDGEYGPAIGWIRGELGRGRSVMGPPSALVVRRSGRQPRGHSCTNSIRVPNDVFGCRNATVVLREPGRGLSSMERPPAARY